MATVTIIVGHPQRTTFCEALAEAYRRGAESAGHTVHLFKLAEMKTEAVVGRTFYDWCVAEHLEGRLTPELASMAKLWLTELQGRVVDSCLQMFGGYGYMNEYPIARMFRDARVQRIYGGTNEIMKLLISRSL